MIVTWSEPQFVAAQAVLRRLEAHGCEAYIVGGAVRDKLLGRDVKDIDIATSAPPDRVEHLFEKTLPTGIAHGTVSVLFASYWFEVTTFRAEGPYDDARHPRFVRFDTTLAGDLARRDFTVNAMAVDANGNLYDPYGGLVDLREQRLRAVGDPMLRFQEDGLRVARALRFAATLGFTIDPATQAAMLESTTRLAKVAPERRQDEWNKFLVALTVARCDEVADEVIEAWTGWHDLRWSCACAQTVNVNGLHDRLAVLLLPFADRAGEALRALRYSRKDADEVMALLRLAGAWQAGLPPALPLAVGKQLAAYGDGFLARAVDVCWAHHPQRDRQADWQLAHAWLESAPLRTERDLAINGSDLVRAFSLQGPAVGALLTYLFEQVAKRALDNQREELLACARAWIESAPLDAALLRSFLAVAPQHVPITVYPSVPSTNDLVRTRLAEEHASFLAVLTDRQESGRGRQGRLWVSPPGKGLALSVALRLDASDFERLAEWPLFAALAVRTALAEVGVADVAIKWPNDIYLHGKKICGILTELRTASGEAHLVIGVGVNVNADAEDFPDDIKARATSLKVAAGRSVSPNRLAARLIDELYGSMQRYLVGMRFRERREEYETHCMTIGQSVRVRQGEALVTGLALGIDDEGTLWVQNEASETLSVRSGEIIES